MIKVRLNISVSQASIIRTNVIFECLKEFRRTYVIFIFLTDFKWQLKSTVLL